MMRHWAKYFIVVFAGLVIPTACNAAPALQRVDQDKPVRTIDEVRALGRRIIADYADKRLAGYGILDVTKAPYLADPTGKKDSTAAIQQAVKDARDAHLITFLPAGIYRVSDTITGIQGIIRLTNLSFKKPVNPMVATDSVHFPCMLIGSSTAKRTKIILSSGAPGFADPNKPKPVIHFWARSGRPERPQPNISFNQMIINIDFVLGDNPGAVGIDHQAAQASVIEDVTIDATGAFAGIQKAQGSGGGTAGLTVIGGRFGLYLRGPSRRLRGTQPAPIFSNLTLKGQTENSILYDGRGPLTIVGAYIEGAPIKVDAPLLPPFNGPFNLIDAVIRLDKDKTGPAINSTHSVYLNNVYFENAELIALIENRTKLKGTKQGWTHVAEYVAGATVRYPGFAGGDARQDTIWVNGQRRDKPLVQIQTNSGPPPINLRSRHTWPKPFPTWQDTDAVNVQQPPYNAKADGKTDDTAAIQRAIDKHKTVFLPKGEYKLSRPLRLKSNTRLIGISNVLSVLSPLDRATAFSDASNPQPLVETVDDANAACVLAFLELRAPVMNPAVYALRWRAGRRSIVRNIYPSRTLWHPSAPVSPYPMIRIEGNGGGKWYNLNQWRWWSRGPSYRHLLVNGTAQPLAFYMLNPEHARSNAMIELRNARNIDIYALKAEGDYTVLWMRNCRDIRIFGYGGNTTPQPDWSIIRIEDSNDFLLANLRPQYKRIGASGPLGIGSDPHKWFIVSDTPVSAKAAITIPGTEQLALYKRGQPKIKE